MNKEMVNTFTLQKTLFSKATIQIATSTKQAPTYRGPKMFLALQPH